MNGWDDGISRLRQRTGVAASLAAAGVLAAARPRYERRVVAHTAGNDLLLTRPGESFPFPADVRVSLVGKAFDVRLTTPEGVVDRTEAAAADVDAVVAAYLDRLLGEQPASLRARLRAVASLTGTPPDFGEVTDAPEPAVLRWLEEAIAAGVTDPTAMALSTVDDAGRPDARMLLLEDLDADGFWFASGAHSAEGRRLRSQGAAALTFWWPPLARQVRVRGTVATGSPEQSDPLPDPALLHAEVDRQLARLDHDPGLVAPDATAFVLRPDEVELWQGDPERRHTRVRWQRTGDGWEHELLWP